ncbi:enoyl-CoA hydratase/isomerase family protein [Micromonospora olivasterospora]|uniref:Enoyl-CoA hydratase/carnithine racemase n=1 Tax=Micromonospora olivasterospora TaxID=1880 RepID=A0A562IB92_MICOL|nr:enoyl-CoA hydratase/isomerase family protein [Micromonospora olivasterospora]TWH68172.1 enoyl-CoA hydratase/carnithine racemase [Micromonospora olivasterospora]
MVDTSSFGWDGHVAPTPLEEYSRRYADFFEMRREDGILELRLHTDGGPYVHNWAAHNAWNRVWQDVGNDPENHVLIITGTGETWFQGDPRQTWPKPLVEETPDYIFQQTIDAWKLIENFVNNIDIPTIAAVNGPGIHTEFALMCDVTLTAEDADFMDPHFMVGTAPGDGLALALQHLMGTKRAAYAIYGGTSIPARKALEYGLVSDVLPREELVPKAWQLARDIMKRPRFARWATHNILNRPWRKLVAEDFGFHFSQQSLATVASKALIPDPDLVADARQRKVW